MNKYVFDNAATQAQQRFESLEALYDDRTKRFLSATGVSQGWHCLEVGAGGGSVASWMADRVGATGRVLVTDIDPSHLSQLESVSRPNVEVQVHDVGVDAIPETTFDLIHARLVLIHVPQREAALSRLVNALKPGGWIVVEDYVQEFIDRGFPAPDPQRYKVFSTVLGALEKVTRSHGVDPRWGLSLYRRFVDLGLADVGHEGHFAAWPGGSQGARLYQANIEQVRSEAVESGLVTNEQIDCAIAELNARDFAFSSPVMMTVWGRKPF